MGSKLQDWRAHLSSCRYIRYSIDSRQDNLGQAVSYWWVKYHRAPRVVVRLAALVVTPVFDTQSVCTEQLLALPVNHELAWPPPRRDAYSSPKTGLLAEQLRPAGPYSGYRSNRFASECRDFLGRLQRRLLQDQPVVLGMLRSG